MEQREIRYPAGDGRFARAILTLPDARAQPAPGLVIIHEMPWYDGEEMSRVATRFAVNGYASMAPDLYADRGYPICVARALWTAQRGGIWGADDISGARRYLAGLPGIDPERMGVVGFCMGGGFALLLAGRGDFRAAAPFYGKVPDDAKELGRPCPIVASYGGRDRVLRGARDLLEKHLVALEQDLVALNVPRDLVEYPDAGHSFMTRVRNPLFAWIGRVSPFRAAYHHESAEHAWRRMLTFFDKHLRALG